MAKSQQRLATTRKTAVAREPWPLRAPSVVGELLCCSRGPQGHNWLPNAIIVSATTIVELRSTGGGAHAGPCMLPYGTDAVPGERGDPLSANAGARR
jgi:hypothetical protein